MSPYLIALGVGLGVGVAYGLLGVRSPAPPVIALLGLLGMLSGETLVSYLRGHPDVLASFGHAKTFAGHRRPGPATVAEAEAESRRGAAS
jgi:XapX domain-containing protein